MNLFVLMVAAVVFAACAGPTVEGGDLGQAVAAERPSTPAEQILHKRELACLRDDPSACELAAWDLWYGEGVRGDADRALKFGARALRLWEQKCKTGDPSACRAFFTDGSPWWTDYQRKRADVVASQVCAGGNELACDYKDRHAKAPAPPPMVAPARASPPDSPKETVSARDEDTCDNGSVDACERVARQTDDPVAAWRARHRAPQIYASWCLSHDGIQDMQSCRRVLEAWRNENVDDNRAFDAATRLCESGYREGCQFLRHVYGVGTAQIPKDAAKSREYRDRACQIEGTTSCDLDPFGRIPKTQIELEHLSEDCEHGKAAACRDLAETYLHDQPGSSHSPRTAANLLDRACDLGDPLACDELAEIYRNGHDVPRDVRRADDLSARARWLRNEP